MRTLITLAAASMLFASPAMAQGNVDANAATTTVTTDNATATNDAMVMDPSMNAALPPADVAPIEEPAPAAPERKSGFPWGLLGLIGLIGLFGRRS